MFEKKRSEWRLVQKLEPPSADTEADEFGREVVISGKYAFVGSSLFGLGAVHVFRSVRGRWAPFGRLPSESGIGLSAVVAARDGDVVAHSMSTGARASRKSRVVIRLRRAREWVEHTILSEPDQGSRFVAPRSMSRDHLLVAGRSGKEEAPVVWIFARGRRSTWSESVRLTSPKPEIRNFGREALLTDDEAFISGLDWATKEGEVYVYSRSRSGWEHVQTLTSCSPGYENLGASLSIDGERLLVGDGSNQFRAGSAHLFRRRRNEWGLERVFLPDERDRRLLFGRSVAMLDDTVVVAAPGPSDLGGGSRVYVSDVAEVAKSDRARERAEPAADDEGVSVLGMRLAGVTPELARKFELESEDGVVILDPGPAHGRFGVGALAAGDHVLRLDHPGFKDSIKDVSEFISTIFVRTRSIVGASLKDGTMMRSGYGVSPSMEISYRTSRGREKRGFPGLWLSESDLRELRSVANRLSRSDEKVGEERGFDVLGMRLIDVTPELKREYELHSDSGALILEPGLGHRRFGIGNLVEGDNFWVVGKNHRVRGVRDFVSELLEAVDAQKPAKGRYAVRVVYSYSHLRPSAKGTFTWEMMLDELDVRELRELREKLPARSP